jgi:sialate O-acetylesterase
VKDKYNYPKAFEIAGADKKWHYAKAEIVNDKIKVWSDAVKAPVAVRYAWTDAPVDANIFNAAGFPLAPFRTDDWPCVTLNNKFE